MAHAFGWKVHHCRPLRRADGRWQTPISGDAGFVDLVLAKQGRLLFVELKAERARPTEGQELWLYHLGWNKNAYANIWRPSDLSDGTIERILGDSLESPKETG